MTPRQAFVLVLLPQAWRAAPPAGDEPAPQPVQERLAGGGHRLPRPGLVAGTSLNQTGRAIECLSIVIAVYLLPSLLAAALSHRLEQRALRGQAA